MTEPAALSATYSDFKLIKTRSVISLSFEVPIEHADIVHQVLGIPVPGKEIGVGIARLSFAHADINDKNNALNDKVPAKPSKSAHGDYAAKLYKSYFMRNEEVCKALGTTEQYKAWIQKQKSCVSKQQDYTGMETGEMKCEESHVERVFAGHGKAIKAAYHSVPLTHAEHSLRHGVNGGEIALLSTLPQFAGFSDEAKKHWFEDKAMEYREKWVHEMLLKQIPKVEVLEKTASLDGTGGSIKERISRYASLADIPPSDIQKWAEDRDLTKYLPKSDLTE